MVSALTIVLATSEPGREYRAVTPAELRADATDTPRIAAVEVEIDPELPQEGRVRVRGDGLVVVAVSGDALCAPVDGAGGAWIEVRFCAPLGQLHVVGRDIDDATTTATVGF